MRVIAVASSAALVMLSLSCTERVRLVTPGENQPRGKILFLLDSTPAEITRVIARLSRRGADEILLSLRISDSTRSASGTMENVAAGTWHLRVDAFDDSGHIRYTGATEVEVFPGETSHADLVLLPASGNLEIHVTWGGSSLTSGLMLYMPFDGSLDDSSGNGNPGTAD
ncbi:MAG TPA: hypothetical protein VGR15_02860, partial [Bacteroidota bacterium]|nr:hypothetical protein [Bacteroidota bacterium]